MKQDIPVCFIILIQSSLSHYQYSTNMMVSVSMITNKLCSNIINDDSSYTNSSSFVSNQNIFGVLLCDVMPNTKLVSATMLDLNHHSLESQLLLWSISNNFLHDHHHHHQQVPWWAGISTIITNNKALLMAILLEALALIDNLDQYVDHEI